MGTREEDHFKLSLGSLPCGSFLFSANGYVYLGIYFECWDLAGVNNLADQELLLCDSFQEAEGLGSSESLLPFCHQTWKRGQRNTPLRKKSENPKPFPGMLRFRTHCLCAFWLFPPLLPWRASETFPTMRVHSLDQNISITWGDLWERQTIMVHTNRIYIFAQVAWEALTTPTPTRWLVQITQLVLGLRQALISFRGQGNGDRERTHLDFL